MPDDPAYEALPLGDYLPPALQSGPVPYERLIAWAAGPLSSLIGILATSVVHSSISKNAAVDVATFVLSSGVTYAAHHKWLSNVPKWWSHVENVVEPLLPSVGDDEATDREIEDHNPLQARAVDQAREDGNELAHRSQNA